MGCVVGDLNYNYYYYHPRHQLRERCHVYRAFLSLRPLGDDNATRMTVTDRYRPRPHLMLAQGAIIVGCAAKSLVGSIFGGPSGAAAGWTVVH